MTKSLAIEYAKKNITINCISPGFIQSRMTDNINESVKSVLTRIPMSKLGTGEDVANSVALSSDQASYITGELYMLLEACIWLDKAFNKLITI